LLSRTRCTTEHWSFFPLSIFENVEASPLHLFPNPAGDYLNIELPDHHLTYDIEIMSVDGRRLLSFPKINSGTFYAKTKDLHSGMYTIRATRGEDLFLGKWMKR